MSTAKASRNPVRAFVERKAFNRLPVLLAELKPRRVLVVLGGQSFRRSAYFAKLLEMRGLIAGHGLVSRNLVIGNSEFRRRQA